MNVWAHIDELKKRHEEEYRQTAAAVKELGCAFFRIDDTGKWRCSLNLGDGKKKLFEARNGKALVESVAEYLKPASGPR